MTGQAAPRPRCSSVPRAATHERNAMSLTESAAPETERADPNDLNSLYKHLRVCDVADALDGIGYFSLTLMSPELRPLWQGMRFWGQAATIRCVPSNKPMWKLDNTQ